MGTGQMPFFDAGSLRNPPVRGLNHLLEVKIGEHLFRQHRTGTQYSNCKFHMAPKPQGRFANRPYDDTFAALAVPIAVAAK